MRIRGGSGLGDAVYLRPVVDYYVKNSGSKITVCSNYPDVFIGSGATVVPFSREKINVVGHYSLRKKEPNTNQWQDVCISAGVPGLALRFDWPVTNPQLIERVRRAAAGRPVVLVHGGRSPMGRSDGFGAELLPQAQAFAHAQAALRDCMFVRIGKGGNLYHIDSEMDLSDKTSICELIDLFCSCDMVLAQCSYAVPLAEAFDKTLIAVWAHKGLTKGVPYIRQITPQKILSKPTSWFIVDNWPKEEIQEEVNGVRLVC